MLPWWQQEERITPAYPRSRLPPNPIGIGGQRCGSNVTVHAIAEPHGMQGSFGSGAGPAVTQWHYAKEANRSLPVGAFNRPISARFLVGGAGSRSKTRRIILHNGGGRCKRFLATTGECVAATVPVGFRRRQNKETLERKENRTGVNQGPGDSNTDHPNIGFGRYKSVIQEPIIALSWPSAPCSRNLSRVPKSLSTP